MIYFTQIHGCFFVKTQKRKNGPVRLSPDGARKEMETDVRESVKQRPLRAFPVSDAEACRQARIVESTAEINHFFSQIMDFKRQIIDTPFIAVDQGLHPAINRRLHCRSAIDQSQNEPASRCQGAGAQSDKPVR